MLVEKKTRQDSIFSLIRVVYKPNAKSNAKNQIIGQFLKLKKVCGGQFTLSNHLIKPCIF